MKTETQQKGRRTVSSGKQRSQQDWELHHRLVGMIAERASKMVSNTGKMEFLAACDEIEKRLKKEWAENAKARQATQPKRDPAVTGPVIWGDLEL
jgi:hypothetical protein